MEKKDIIELKDEELNEVNGGKTIEGSEAQFSAYSSDRAKYAALAEGRPSREDYATSYKKAQVEYKSEVKSYRGRFGSAMTDIINRLPGAYFIIQLFGKDID